MKLTFFSRAVLAALIAVTSGCTEEAVLHIRSKFPVVSFDVYQPDANGVIHLPPNPPPRSVYLDEDGVSAIRAGDKIARHIADISGQASGMRNPDLDMDAALTRDPTITNSESAALNWLLKNRIEIGDAWTWHYTFDFRFNNILIKSGWPSAFAQADVIKAFLLAYRKTNDQKYIDAARRTGQAYAIPCEAGGLRCVVGGYPWYEEYPLPYGYAPMILNGHLYSLVMLHRLFAATGDAEVKKLFDDGLKSAVALIPRYDLGYWTEYQARPRLKDVPLAIAPSSDGTVIARIDLISAMGRRSSITFAPPQQSATTFAPEQLATFAGSVAYGAKWGRAKESGRSLDGVAYARILPGAPAVDTDPINYGSYTVSIHYSAKGCSPPLVGTLDWRIHMRDYIAIPRLSVQGGEDGCEASYLLASTNNQWGQLDELYQDWHTRLVEELGRITGDVRLEEIGARWRSYIEDYHSDLEHRNDTVLREPKRRSS